MVDAGLPGRPHGRARQRSPVPLRQLAARGYVESLERGRSYRRAVHWRITDTGRAELARLDEADRNADERRTAERERREQERRAPLAAIEAKPEHERSDADRTELVNHAEREHEHDAAESAATIARGAGTLASTAREPAP